MWKGTVQAGGGLVIGSNPASEVEEAKWKAAALRKAAGWITEEAQSKLPIGEVAIYPQKLNKKPLNPRKSTGIIERWGIERNVYFDNRPRVVFIDNLDSFSWNIIHACANLNANVLHVCGLTTEINEWKKIVNSISPTHVILGPGPGRPSNSELTQHIASMAISGKLQDGFGKEISLLGICLGHQAIGEAMGMNLIESPLGPVHGSPVKIIHGQFGLFSELSSPALMARYNSLVLEPLDCDLETVAWDETMTLPMAFRHRIHNIHSVQFHPESCGSEFGMKILEAFIESSPDIQPWASHG